MVDTQEIVQWVAPLGLTAWLMHTKSTQVKRMSINQTEIDDLNSKVTGLTNTVNSLGDKVTKIGIESTMSVAKIAELKQKIEDIESEEDVDLTELKESLGVLETSVNNVVGLAAIVDDTVVDTDTDE